MASIEEEPDAALLAVAILKSENARYIERIEELTSELSKLKVQADRYREALELLAKDTSGTCCECLEIKDIAREALKGGQ